MSSSCAVEKQWTENEKSTSWQTQLFLLLHERLIKDCTTDCLTYEDNKREPYNDNLCLFRAPALPLNGNQRLEEQTSKSFNLFMSRMYGLSPNQFQRIHINDITLVEDLSLLNFFLYEIDNVEENLIGEVVWRDVQKHKNTVWLLRYNNHICYLSKNNAVFKSFRCPNFDTFFNRTSSMEQHWTTWSERVKSVYPRNVYQIRESLFDKLDSFDMKYTSEKKTLRKFLIFVFDSNCVQEETFRDTKTKPWIGKHVPISVSSYSNLVEEPILLCNSDPHHLLQLLLELLIFCLPKARRKWKTCYLIPTQR